jgi:hypothetical protein
MPFIGPKPADTVLDSTLIADGTITSAKIADGAIVNADLNSSAAIDTSKISGLAASATTDTTNAANIASGTIADARISASSVQQHATSFDDNKLVNDISTLALRQASDQNKSAYNTNSQSVDVFQDDTGIDTTTNTDRNASEYMSSIVSSVATADAGGTITGIQDNNTDQSGASSWGNYGNGNGGQVGTNTADYNVQLIGTSAYLTGDFVLGFSNASITNSDSHTGDAYYQVGFEATNNNSNNNLYGANFGAIFAAFNGVGSDIKLIEGNTAFQTISGAFSNSNTYRFARVGSTLYFQVNDATVYTIPSGNYNKSAAEYVHIGFGKGSTTRLLGSESTGVYYRSNMTAIKGISTVTTTSATGNFTSTTITAPSSVSEMGAIITYQDNAGTNALNTDIVLQLSADGGSNYSTATLTALPDFSTGIKMAKVNDLAVTAGTQLKYKISFANQASGSKEARIRGVALQY